MKNYYVLKSLLTIGLFNLYWSLLFFIKKSFFNDLSANMLVYYFIAFILFGMFSLPAILINEKLSNQPSPIFLRNLKIICAILIGVIIIRWLNVLF